MKTIKKEQKLNNWQQVDDNLYFFKDKKGVVWQLLRTPYQKIPKGYKNKWTSTLLK